MSNDISGNGRTSAVTAWFACVVCLVACDGRAPADKGAKGVSPWVEAGASDARSIGRPPASTVDVPSRLEAARPPSGRHQNADGGQPGAGLAGDNSAEPGAFAPGCSREPYVPDKFEPPCERPRAIPKCREGWCTIEPGCFIMGDSWCQWQRAKDRTNPTQVTLTRRFRIQQFELTQRQWTSQGVANPSGGMPDQRGDCPGGNCPVGNVNFMEALGFANLMSRRGGLAECYSLGECKGELGKGMSCETARSVHASIYDCRGYRLPTGAEWEYAARAGTKTSVYTGDVVDRGPAEDCYEDPALSPIAWYCANSGPLTHPVGRKAPNAWGLHDLIGNAGEWSASGVDAYGPGPYVDWGSEFMAKGITGHTILQSRGGHWTLWPSALRASAFVDMPAWLRNPGQGFRLVQTRE